jgi:hypothetical protein
MPWIKQTLSKVFLFIWNTLQGIWLFILYLLVGTIMVGSLGSLQLRDALELGKDNPTYDEVMRIKQDFDIKEQFIRNKTHRNQKHLYEEVNEIELEIDVLFETIYKKLSEGKAGQTDNFEIYSTDFLTEFDQIKTNCTPDKANDDLCINHNRYLELMERADTKYNTIDQASSADDDQVVVMDEITKLRNETPHSELFSTVQFMTEFGFEDFLKQPRELLVLQLTMVMGVLGSLVTMTWLFIRRDTELGARRTLFLPLVGGVSAFIIFVFFKAGQLTISSGSGGSSLSPFFLSFVGIISGLLSERAYARMESVGSKFFTVEGDNLRWGVRLRVALDESGLSISNLASYLGVEEGTAKKLVDEITPATQNQQLLIAACLRQEIRELFTDAAPKGIVIGEQAQTKTVVQVPSFIGLQFSEVTAVIAAQGLILGDVIELPSDVELPGNIIDQQPVANQIAHIGDVVTVTVSSGKTPQE